MEYPRSTETQDSDKPAAPKEPAADAELVVDLLDKASTPPPRDPLWDIPTSGAESNHALDGSIL